MKPRIVAAIARKELIHLARDLRSLVLAFAIPLLLIILFGYALSLDVNDVPFVVVDHDHSAAGRELVRALDASLYFRVVETVEDARAAQGFLDSGRAVMVLAIPSGYASLLHADRPSPVQVLIDGSDPNLANMTRGYVSSVIASMNRRMLVEYLSRKGMNPVREPVDERLRVWFNEDLASSRFIVPGIIAIIIMIAGAMLTSLVIAREFENGTFETLKSLPITAGEFLLGKAVPYFAIALVDVLVAVLLGQVLFGVVMKCGFVFMILVSSLYITVALALGLFISATLRSQLLANQAAILLTYLPSFLLSDFVFPISNLPAPIAAVTYIVPARYFMKVLTGIYLRGTGIDRLWPDLAALGAMLAVLSFFCVRILKREGM